MPTVTDFDQWLADNTPDNGDEIESLYTAIGGQSVGIYEASKDSKGSVYIKRASGDATLALVSSDAISAFKRRIEDIAGELGVHGRAVFEKAMRKDD